MMDEFTDNDNNPIREDLIPKLDLSWLEDSEFDNTLNRWAIPIYLLVNGLATGLFTQILSLIVVLSPFGFVISSDILMTTLLSPILIISFPFTANELYWGHYPRCIRLSDMLVQWD